MNHPLPAVDYGKLSLTELAELVRGGQHEAFQPIVQRCNQRLFRVARAVLDDDQEAEDALQDAYIKAYQHIASFRGEAQLTTWLTRIVLNECHMRLRRRRPTVGIEQIDRDTSSAVVPFPTRPAMSDPVRGAARAQMRQIIEQAIDSLPEGLRLVFVLREVEQCSVLETAQTLGIHPTTVKTRLFRARRRLRKNLEYRLAPSLGDSFPFLGSRCAGLTEAVMHAIGQLDQTLHGDR